MRKGFNTKSIILGLLISLILPMKALSLNNTDSPGRYAVLYYAGQMTDRTLGQVVGGNIVLDYEALYSAEFSYIFRPEQGIRRYFSLIFQSIEANFNITCHDDHHQAKFEFVPYLSFRWNRFPWNNIVKTSISLGEGISWISRVSTREYRNSDDPQSILNYLNFEITAASPNCPRLEIVGRIHHRSGVFGLYRSTNSGSSAVGVGFRLYFDSIPS
jgi:hypothetical protein